jgi:hypothetical protein
MSSSTIQTRSPSWNIPHIATFNISNSDHINSLTVTSFSKPWLHFFQFTYLLISAAISLNKAALQIAEKLGMEKQDFPHIQVVYNHISHKMIFYRN